MILHVESGIHLGSVYVRINRTHIKIFRLFGICLLNETFLESMYVHVF